MTFKKLSEYFQQLEQNTSRLKITEILSDLFKEAKADEIENIVNLSLGQLLPAYQGVEFQMAQKTMEKAISKAFGIEVIKVMREMKETGDLGETGERLKKEAKGKKQERLFGDVRPASPATCVDAGAKRGEETGDVSVKRVYERLLEIAKEGGGGSVERKIDKMAALLQDLDALSVRYVIRMPLGKMRLGFSEMTVLDSLSWILKGDKSLRGKLEDAYNVVADIGVVARKIREVGDIRGIRGIKPKLGTPVVPALCQRIDTAEEIIEKLGKCAVEPKYDGTRLQIHLWDKDARIFTRSLENVTHMFPDIIKALRQEIKAKEVILDGEGVGVDPKTGRYIPFQETIKRKRKYDIDQTAKDIPLKYFVFDILYKDGESLIKVPFEDRRKILSQILDKKQNTIVLSPQIITESPKELREYHDKQISLGLEGVVIKKWQSFYEPGRRGFHWVKLKQEKSKKGGGLADTVDVVVMGTYRGKGKRTSFGVGAFLVGLKKGERFVTVSKIGTGLTDEQFRELKVKSSKCKVKEKPKDYEVDKNLTPDTWCKPEIMVEVQADNITKSPLHSAGYALRFPRLINFREDKSPLQATTTKELEKLFAMQFGK